MSITCQVCATVNPDTAQFCDGCGVELTHQPSSAAPAALPADPAQGASTDSGAAPDLTASTPDLTSVPALTPPLDPAPEAHAAGHGESGTSAGETPALTGEAASLDTGLADMPAPSDAAPETGSAAPSTDPAPSTAGTGSEGALQEAPGSAALAAGEPAPGEAAMPTAGPEAINAEPASPAADLTAGAAVAAAASGSAMHGGPARLGIRKFGAPTGDFIPLQGEKLVVGRFDASSGPVDIDLSALGGAEHISRRHAELSQQGGQWTVTDLGSTNGVFIKRKGEGAFSPRLQEPTALADGDEVAFGNLVLTFQQG